ncbi:ABC transporter substrate-binding protein [Bradyrhizobium sp. BR 1432]|uniref:ABC transporter substrate-binding protein n=1 Tax=Bradyrhizobium sp. BR 1432 TaxID=3447966 RepID=UPI003EE43B3B
MRFHRVLVVLFAAMFGLSSAVCAEDKGSVVVAAWGGTYQDALREAIFKPFEVATGIKVVEATGPTMSKLRAMLQAGSPEWDVADLLPGDYLQLSGEGQLQQLDYTAIDPSVFADFPKQAVQPSGVGTFVYAKVIAFNTKKYTTANGPKSWADVWDVKKFPGPRTLDAGNTNIPPIEIALLADGVAPEKLYPLDFKRAYAALSRIKPNVVKWTTAAAMQVETLISGEAVIGPATLGRLQLAKEQGAPVDFVWDGAMTDFSYWAILKGAKNAGNALKFIEFASRPESQAALVKIQLLGPLNRKVFDLISEERAKLLPTYPQNLVKTIELNPAWWAKKEASGKSNLEINNALWNEWILQR